MHESDDMCTDITRAYLRLVTNAASSESDFLTLSTVDRTAKNCSCAIKRTPSDADGLRTEAFPGEGTGAVALPASIAAPTRLP